ncbi:MAG: type II toxin-antitoxin system Phd/YefM family antitoxin [Acidobacteriota bacterium]
MTRVAAEELAVVLPDLVRRVAAGDVIVVMRSANVAALVFQDDPEVLRTIEDAIDNAAADTALAEPGDNIPLDDVLARYGIKR